MSKYFSVIVLVLIFLVLGTPEAKRQKHKKNRGKGKTKYFIGIVLTYNKAYSQEKSMLLWMCVKAQNYFWCIKWIINTYSTEDKEVKQKLILIRAIIHKNNLFDQINICITVLRSKQFGFLLKGDV